MSSSISRINTITVQHETDIQQLQLDFEELQKIVDKQKLEIDLLKLLGLYKIKPNEYLRLLEMLESVDIESNVLAKETIKNLINNV